MPAEAWWTLDVALEFDMAKRKAAATARLSVAVAGTACSSNQKALTLALCNALHAQQHSCFDTVTCEERQHYFARCALAVCPTHHTDVTNR